MISVEVACRRYLQIHEIEVAVRLCEASILDVQKELDAAEERLGELRKTKSDLLKDMRAAARDEGQLPLFDVATRLSTAKAGHETEVRGG